MKNEKSLGLDTSQRGWQERRVRWSEGDTRRSETRSLWERGNVQQTSLKTFGTISLHQISSF